MTHAPRRRPTARPPSNATRSAPSRVLLYGCLAATLLLVIVVRYRLLDVPLERDEGEYALMGQLIARGIPPYAMAYNMKLPGTYYMYALVMSVFGQSAAGIRLGLMVINLASILLLFAIGKRLINDTAALLAASSFALLTLSPGIYGFAAHATHFNMVFALAGLLALLRYAERPTWPRLALSGVAFGLSFVMKQQVVFLLLFGLLALGGIERRRTPFRWPPLAGRLGAFAGALTLPYVGVLLTAWLTGTFQTFWHWTFEYAGQYVGITTARAAWTFFSLHFPGVTEGYAAFWLVGLAGVAAVVVSAGARKYKWLMLTFVACSLASVAPGFYFRPHYFVLCLPALALMVGVALNWLAEKLPPKSPWPIAIPLLIFCGMVVPVMATHGATFFTKDVNAIVTETYGSANPFQASPEIARFIRDNSSAEDTVAILGSEPQIYFYSRRLPATGFIYTYPLMEDQAYSREMQRDMIAEIEQSRPRFLVFVNSSVSWTRSPRSANDIFDWFERYRSNYTLVGLVDLNTPGEPTYAWRGAVNARTAIARNQVGVFERK